MPVLIIEGPDLAGKGFAIEKICKRLHDGYLIKNLYKPVSYPDQKIYSQYYEVLRIYETQEGSIPLILDRFFPSQAVYSYLRNHDEMDSEQILDLDNECAKHNFLYVYLDTDLEVLKKRFLERGDEHIKLDDLITLKQRYNIFYNKTSMRKIKLDTTQDNWLDVLESFVKENEHK
jgi:thymidylate kinase